MIKNIDEYEDYVKFFLQRNGLLDFNHFDEIKENAQNDERIVKIFNNLEN